MERIKTVGTITGVLLLACGILNFTVGIGTIYIGFQQTAQILWQIFQGTANGNILADVIYYLRLPRLVLAAVVGYGLSITGCVMQAVMRNSLAILICWYFLRCRLRCRYRNYFGLHQCCRL